MKLSKNRFAQKFLGAAFLVIQGISLNAFAGSNCLLLRADRVFDGYDLHNNAEVLIKGRKIVQVGAKNSLQGCSKKMDLGNATIMPGFIESHAHITFQNVRKDTVLEHGITTVQDTGGPIIAPEGGYGKLRLLSTGPILQAPGGYPLNIFGGTGGYDQVGYPVGTVEEARAAVQHLVDGGATAIKIALEPGGETGAPWMQPHGEKPVPVAPWDILDKPIVEAIVDEAHHPHDGRPVRRVIVHVGENEGFQRALDAGVDEFAHMPCAPIGSALIAQAAKTPGLTFVSTVDTLSSCVDTTTHMGIHSNTAQLAEKIADCQLAQPGQCAQILYGSEIGHDNVPWGVNGEEMVMLLHLTSGKSIDFGDVLNVFKSVTSSAGKNIGIKDLGTLLPNAPADVIAVRGNAIERFKLLEYPDLVISGGYVVINKFK